MLLLLLLMRFGEFGVYIQDDGARLGGKSVVHTLSAPCRSTMRVTFFFLVKFFSLFSFWLPTCHL